jgi:hypothetical protein
MTQSVAAQGSPLTFRGEYIGHGIEVFCADCRPRRKTTLGFASYIGDDYRGEPITSISEMERPKSGPVAVGRSRQASGFGYQLNKVDLVCPHGHPARAKPERFGRLVRDAIRHGETRIYL